jgi:DNA invertase Pin-like site-specific DNA recombinase
VKTKAVAYERVSDEGQTDGYSIEKQRDQMQTYARQHNIDIVAWFGGAESAYRPGRREFARMRAFLTEHTDVRTILLYKLDRVTRNLLDFARLVEEDRITLLSATEHFGDGPTGQFGQTIVAATAKLYSAMLSARVTDAMRTKAKKGLWPSSAPIGFLNCPHSRAIVVDPERGTRIRELFERYDREEISLQELTRLAEAIGLRTRGGNPLSKSALHKTLQNPIYPASSGGVASCTEERTSPL